MDTMMEKFPEFSNLPIYHNNTLTLSQETHFSSQNPSFPFSSLSKHPNILDNQQETFFMNNKNANNMAAMREMIFRIAVMQPIHIDPESIKPVKRRNVKISKDPQSVAARNRRERISEKIRILQRLVPGGTKMDTASMLDEAIHYVKFLKKQVQTLEEQQQAVVAGDYHRGFGTSSSYNAKSFDLSSNQMMGNTQMMR